MKYNKKTNKNVSFFYNNNKKLDKVNIKDNLEDNINLSTLDPLIGYSLNFCTWKIKGYEINHNMILLKTKTHVKTQKRIKILITGGSTSDLTYDTENWPIYLLKLLDEKKYNADIYIGAVVGYDSGQELLKLLSDGLAINPDVHISLSGINDYRISSYVSDYEMRNYKKILSNGPSIMPNTIVALAPGYYMGPNMELIERYDPNNVNFYLNNVYLMNSLAERNNYLFLDLLQPYKDPCWSEGLLLKYGNKNDVLNYNNLFYKNNPLINYVELFSDPIYRDSIYSFFSIPFLTQINYKIANKGKFALYELFIKGIKSRVDSCNYIYDFTSFFDSINENPFIDHCHILPKYQPIVAGEILKLLEQKGIFNDEVQQE